MTWVACGVFELDAIAYLCACLRIAYGNLAVAASILWVGELVDSTTVGTAEAAWAPSWAPAWAPSWTTVGAAAWSSRT